MMYSPFAPRSGGTVIVVQGYRSRCSLNPWLSSLHRSAVQLAYRFTLTLLPSSSQRPDNTISIASE